MTYFDKVKLGLAYNFKSPWKTYKKLMGGFYCHFYDFVGYLCFCLIFAVGSIIAPIFLFVFSMVLCPFLWPITSEGRLLKDEQWEKLRDVKEKSDRSESV